MNTQQNVRVDISTHELLKEAYALCLAIEDCGASEKLTEASIKASNLLQSIANYLDELKFKPNIKKINIVD